MSQKTPGSPADRKSFPEQAGTNGPNKQKLDQFYWRIVNETGFGKKYLNADPDLIRPNKEILAYCDSGDYRYGKGLFITGPVGVGKTNILSYIAFRIIESYGIKCLAADPARDDYWSSPAKTDIRCLSMRELSDLLFNVGNREASDRLREIERVKYLLLDDFGSEYRTAFLEARFEGFIECRYSEKLTTVITSNISLEHLFKSRQLERTYDRFREMLKPLTISGKSMRGGMEPADYKRSKLP